MKVKDVIFYVQGMAEINGVTLTADNPSVLQFINEAAQDVWPIARMHDPEFYNRSATFTSGTTINHPTDYHRTKLIEVSTSVSGAARIAQPREYDYINDNEDEMGSTDNPLAVINSGSFTISPASAGTHYYECNIQQLTPASTSSYTQDLSLLHDSGTKAQIPWMFEELVLLKTLYLTMQREMQKPEVPQSEQVKMLTIQDEVARQIKMHSDTHSLFRQDTTQSKMM